VVSMLVDVGALEDFREGSGFRIVSVKGQEVGIVRWKGQVYALRNYCPHQGGPVCRGTLGVRLVGGDGKPGVIEIDPETPIIACAWHRWEFDIRTGTAVWDTRYRVQTYSVVIKNDRVLVEAR